MKIAIITDQHFGARKGSALFHDYFLKFYNDVFFPTLEKEGITTIVDMGDTFDNRRGIDFLALDWAKENYFNRLRDMNIKVHTIVGNHTAYYKNTNEVNTIQLLLKELNFVLNNFFLLVLINKFLQTIEFMRVELKPIFSNSLCQLPL